MSGSLLNYTWQAVVIYFLLAPSHGPCLLAAEPIRCSPCTAEKLLGCPAVPTGCVEVARERVCGCCTTCALQKGDLCGLYTAGCGSSLRCYPREGDSRPLHSLTRGQAICMEPAEVARIQDSQTLENKGLTENDNTEDTSVYRDPHSLHNRLMPPLGHVTHEKPFDPRNTVDAQESTKAKNKAFRKKAVEQGPCHIELSRELDKIAKSQQKMGEKFNRFHLPNCDRHGFYRAKQCEASLDGERGKCWCVYPWNGKSIPGSPEVRGDPECQQYLALQEQDQTR